MTIKAVSKRAKLVEEEFFCYAVSEKKSGKCELIMSFKMKAEFVEPLLRLSEHVLNFMVTDDDINEPPELECKIEEESRRTIRSARYSRS